jgi:hypothetical protein
MGDIISIVRDPLAIAKVPNGEGGFDEIEAPRMFVVGQAAQEGDAVVKAVKYQYPGSVWLRRPHYEIHFEDSDVKRLIPEEEVKDVAVDMATKKKKKKAGAEQEGPDLSVPEEG